MIKSSNKAHFFYSSTFALVFTTCAFPPSPRQALQNDLKPIPKTHFFCLSPTLALLLSTPPPKKKKSGFREFGDDSEGRVVEKQLAQDTALLDDLKCTLYDVLTWDHTHGVPETGGGGSGSQDRGALAEPTAAAAVAAAATAATDRPSTDLPAEKDEQEEGTSCLVLPEAAQSRHEQPRESAGEWADRRGTPEDASDEELAAHHPQQSLISSGSVVGSTSALSMKSRVNNDDVNEANVVLDQNIPVVVLGLREDGAGVHASLSGDNEIRSGADQDLKPAATMKLNCPSRGGLRITECHTSNGGTAGPNVKRVVDRPSEGEGIATTASTTTATMNSSGSCGEWVRRQKRTDPIALTDNERMSMLYHVRPSVFGEPVAAGRLRGAAAAAAPRPRSAADALGGVSRHSNYAATETRRRSRQGGWSARKFHTKGTFSKRQGVLVHDGWVGEDDPARMSTPMMSSSQGLLLPRESPCNRKVGGGGRRPPPSFVDSVAFGVNMGMLDSLSGTTASETAAAAYAYAAGVTPWSSAVSASKPSGGKHGIQRRGQSAPPERRQDHNNSRRETSIDGIRRWTPPREHKPTLGRSRC